MEIIVDSQEVVKKFTESFCVFFTQFSLTVTSYVVIVQYHSQETDIGTIHRACSNFTSSVFTLLGVCIYNSVLFLSHVYIRVTTTVKIQNCSISTKPPHATPLQSYTP